MLNYLGTDQPIRYWCQDESRLGLKTLTGKVITLKGIKPKGINGWARDNLRSRRSSIMVDIRYPPPTRNINPLWFELKSGTTIQRIFDPTSYGATAMGFRYYGPLSRFDQQQSQKPELHDKRGIIYAGLSLSCCLIEVFGDDETIKIQQQKIAYITLRQSLKLLDLRDSGAWGAGSVGGNAACQAAYSTPTRRVAVMAVDGRRKLTQAWSRYFYENPDLYGNIDGLIFKNAHDGQAAIALYERAIPQLSSADILTLNLNDPTIRESILTIANRLNLLVEIEHEN